MHRVIVVYLSHHAPISKLASVKEMRNIHRLLVSREVQTPLSLWTFQEEEVECLSLPLLARDRRKTETAHQTKGLRSLGARNVDPQVIELAF
jgi:hypothetical protein